MSVSVTEVREFWNANPCQSTLSRESDRRQYFEEIARKRFQGREWHVPLVARFGDYAGKDVLEVGCGIATDGLEFAKRGARYAGVDLTPNSIEIAKERFALFGLEGKLQVANAEQELPFGNGSFDHIYSFGVIHHSPRTEAIVKEMHRVLRPGGSLTVMVYNRSSINYYVEIMLVRRIGRWMLYPKFMPHLISKVTGFDEWKLVGHREMLLKGRISKEQWISMNTDGPHCPLAKVYNKREADQLFQDFRNVTQEVWEFNTDHWPAIGRLIPTRLAQQIGRRYGWHRVIRATK
jgi:ubiquinone/menaquinone biosynthesis C-methylase UbiE